MSSTSSYQYLSRLENAVKQHESWRVGECLNMIASENFSSPQTRGMLVTDFGNRYTAPDKFYRGSRFMDEVQALAEEVARKVFNAKFADVRPTLRSYGGHGPAADARQPRGQGALGQHRANGGYPGISHVGLGKILGLKNLYFAYDEQAVNIDVKATKRLIELEMPKLVIFGSSFIPFPQPVREVSNMPWTARRSASTTARTSWACWRAASSRTRSAKGARCCSARRTRACPGRRAA